MAKTHYSAEGSLIHENNVPDKQELCYRLYIRHYNVLLVFYL